MDRLRNSNGCKAADANTGYHHLHPLAHDKISHLAEIRAEGDANADFLTALPDYVAQHAVSSERAQQQGEQTKSGHEHHQQPSILSVPLHEMDGSNLPDRLIFVETPHCLPDCIRQAHGVDCGSQD